MNFPLKRKSGKLGSRPEGLTREAKKTVSVLMGMYQKQENGKYKYSISEICAALKISKGTLYKFLNIRMYQKEVIYFKIFIYD